MESKIIAITGINNSSYTSQFATNNTNSAKKADGEKEIVFSAVGSDIKQKCTIDSIRFGRFIWE